MNWDLCIIDIIDSTTGTFMFGLYTRKYATSQYEEGHEEVLHAGEGQLLCLTWFKLDPSMDK